MLAAAKTLSIRPVSSRKLKTPNMISYNYRSEAKRN
jgi:hypothetical protein